MIWDLEVRNYEFSTFDFCEVTISRNFEEFRTCSDFNAKFGVYQLLQPLSSFSRLCEWRKSCEKVIGEQFERFVNFRNIGQFWKSCETTKNLEATNTRQLLTVSYLRSKFTNKPRETNILSQLCHFHKVLPKK